MLGRVQKRFGSKNFLVKNFLVQKMYKFLSLNIFGFKKVWGSPKNYLKKNLPKNISCPYLSRLDMS